MRVIVKIKLTFNFLCHLLFHTARRFSRTFLPLGASQFHVACADRGHWHKAELICLRMLTEKMVLNKKH